MSASAVLDLLGAYADTLDRSAQGLDDVEVCALSVLDIIGAAEARGSANAFRAVARALRTDDNTSGPGVELELTPTADVPLGPGDGNEFDMTPADLHDEWAEVLA